MIIDKICDIINSQQFTESDARQIYDYAQELELWDLSRALDAGTENDIKGQLAQYIVRGGYALILIPELCAVPIVGDWL